MAQIEHHDIVPVTAFIRNYKTHLERITESGRPQFLAIDGVPKMAVLTMDDYARYAEAREYLESIRDIRAGMEDIEAGRVHDMEDVHDEMRAL